MTGRVALILDRKVLEITISGIRTSSSLTRHTEILGVDHCFPEENEEGAPERAPQPGTARGPGKPQKRKQRNQSLFLVPPASWIPPEPIIAVQVSGWCDGRTGPAAHARTPAASRWTHGAA